MPQLSENTGHWGRSQIRQGYRSRFRLLLQVWYLYIFCIIYIVVSFQKQQHSTSKMHQTRYLLPGCRGSHRLPQPHQGGLVALPMGGGQDPTTLAQPPAELAGQQHLTTGWATSLILSQLPTGNPCWQSCQPLCPQLLLSTKGDGEAPFLMVGWNGVLGSGQDGGKTHGQVARDIRAVTTLRGVIQCDTNIWAKHTKYPELSKLRLRLQFIWANLSLYFKMGWIMLPEAPLTSPGCAWAPGEQFRQRHLHQYVEVRETVDSWEVTNSFSSI